MRSLQQWLADTFNFKPPIDRSAKWAAVRKRHLKENPRCRWCGGRLFLDVHHIFPVHVYPSLELCRSNLITLCRFNSCHFEQGHNGNWHEYNVEIEFQCDEKDQQLTKEIE